MISFDKMKMNFQAIKRIENIKPDHIWGIIGFANHSDSQNATDIVAV